MRAAVSVVVTLACLSGCDLGSTPSPVRDGAGPATSPARGPQDRPAGATAGGRAAPTLTAATAPLPAPTGASRTGPAVVTGAVTGAVGAPPGAAPSGTAQLATPARLATVEEGGCSLVGADARYLYARAPSCKAVLRIDRASGAVETKSLPSAMLVEAVVEGVAYGCPLGDSAACKLTRAALDGGPAKQVAVLPGMMDGPNAAVGGSIAAVFVPVSATGRLDLQRQEHSIETVDLGSGARTVVAGPVGIGKVANTSRGVLFEGARTPKENVGAASWGLWLFQAGAEPRRLPAGDVSAMSADDRHVYYTTHGRELRRTALDGTGDEALTGEIAEPPSEANRLRVSPSVRVTQDAVYVSTASGKACWVWKVARP